MTTDDFTEAARAEAERRLAYHDRQFGSLMPPMLHMAEWARARLAAQELTDAEVEAAVLGELAYLQGYDLADEEDRAEVLAWWNGMDEEVRASRIATARAALSAARAARRDEEKR